VHEGPERSGDAIDHVPHPTSLTDAIDPSSTDVAAGFEYRFDCGSGYGGWSPASSADCTGSTAGVLTVRGAIRDKDDGSTAYEASVSVEERDIQWPGIEVQQVRIGSASKSSAGSANGSFRIMNQSDGEDTQVRLGDVTVSFRSTSWRPFGWAWLPSWASPERGRVFHPRCGCRRQRRDRERSGRAPAYASAW
jgi:hypothetical protein